MKDEPKVKQFPPCQNKRDACMVCLNEGCEGYAFFCLQCEDQSCEKVHRHENKDDKLMAIGFKEFIRRVLRERKPTEELENAINTYKDTLERLRKDINQFVQKELRHLTQVLSKARQAPQELAANLKKLKQKQYQGLKGKQMDVLWRNCGDSHELLKMQHQTAEFIKIKEEELKAISEHFENLNKIEVDKIDEGTEPFDKQIKRETSTLKKQTQNVTTIPNNKSRTDSKAETKTPKIQ